MATANRTTTTRTVEVEEEGINLTLTVEEAADLRGIIAGLRHDNGDQPSLVSIYEALTNGMKDDPLPWRFADGLVGARVNFWEEF